MIVTVLSAAVLLFAALGLLSALWAAVRDFREWQRPDQDAHWDEDCGCCTAGCGDVDEENTCLTCQH